MLDIRDLSKKYKKQLAVDHLSFSVPEGKVGILLGPNGAGKSTTIKSIAGLLRYEGQVVVGGFPARSMEAKKIFAYVPEIPSTFPALTVAEHLEYIRRAYQSSIRDEEVEALLERFEMADKKDKLGNELSKGMMQKLSILCALCIRPRVILLDEPMVGLDPAAIKELKNVILEMRDAGVTILISTHMLEMVQELWDIVYIMDKGRLVAVYDKESAHDQTIEDLFFQITEGKTGTEGQEAEADKEVGV